MPTSEDLVANDQPYGSRQQTVAGMQQAGIPTSSSGGPPAPGQGPTPGQAPPRVGPQMQPSSPLDLISQHSPGDFPFIGNTPTNTSSPAESPDSVMTALGASAQSSFAKAVLARLNSR